MKSAFCGLGRPAMNALAEALEGGRIAPPFRDSQVRGQVPDELVEGILDEMQELSERGMAPAHIAHMLRVLAEERAAAQVIADRVALVWSGTEVLAGRSRDTAVVVQELFREARDSVLVASYALDTGSKAEALFGLLAARMDVEPDLHVRLFLNVHRKHRDETSDVVLLREFADAFCNEVWPGTRLPEVFHDPRSLAIDGTKRACLHAKCVVIDEDRALITSANFTEAAHERNIEAGTVITDAIHARALKAQFDTLVDHGALKRVPGIEKLCAQCGKPMQRLRTVFESGEVKFTYECRDFKCSSGPGGLLTIRTIDKLTGETTKEAKFWDLESFEEWEVGRPSQGEQNVASVATVFMQGVNRTLGTSFDTLVPGPESSREEGGFDCVVRSGSEGYELKLQVTRALPSNVQAKQGRAGRRDLQGTTEAVSEWLTEAVRRKTNSAASDIALVLDGIQSPVLALVSDIRCRERDREFLEAQRWHSIWVVGPEWVSQLAGKTLP